MGWLKDKMELAKQADAAEERAPVKPSRKREKKGKKKSVLERVGVKIEKEATPQDRERKEREESIIRVWDFVRRQIDLGIHEYFTKGESEKLREFVTSPAYGALTAHLDRLRKAGVYWSQPERKGQTKPRVTVIQDKIDEFIVEERFTDTSQLQRIADGATRTCDGEERAIRATVVVKGQDYKLKSVIRVARAQL